MNILVTGGTGLIGAELVRAAIADARITEIRLLSRNPSSLKHEKITELIHPDFMHYDPIRNDLRDLTAVCWCLGVSQTQVSREQYEQITFGYVDQFIRHCKNTNAGIRFIFVSGEGADRSEKSKTLFKRIKGKAENALIASGLPDYYIVRPGAVRPIHKNPNAPLAYKLGYPLFPLLELFSPSAVIRSDRLGKAIAGLAVSGFEKRTIENATLKLLGS